MPNENCPKCAESGEIGPYRSLGGPQSLGVLSRYRIVLCNRCYCSVTNKKRVLLEHTEKRDAEKKADMHEFLSKTLQVICMKPSLYTVIVTGAAATIHEEPLRAHEGCFKRQTKKQREKMRVKEIDPVIDSPKEKPLSRADVEEFINSTHRFFNLLREAEVEYIAQAKKLLQ